MSVDALAESLNYPNQKRRAVASRSYRVKISPNNGQTFVAGQTVNIDMPSNLAGSRFIFLKFTNLSVNNLNSNGLTDNAIVRIDNNAPFGYYIFYRPAEVHRFIMRRRVIDSLHFRLTDTKGNDLNLWSGDCQITLKIEYLYKPSMRNVEEGTIQYELQKLAKIPKLTEAELEGVYNPETNQFLRE